MAKTLCPNCDREVSAHIVHNFRKQHIRDIDVTYASKRLICDVCGEDIGLSTVVGEDLNHLYEAYRRAVGLPHNYDISTRLTELKLTPVEFAHQLKISSFSIHRMLEGGLPLIEDEAAIIEAFSFLDLPRKEVTHGDKRDSISH